MKKSILDISMPDYLNEAIPADDHEATPFEVLNTAAVQMGKRTGDMVQAKVYLAPFLGTMRYTFYLVIPTLNDYTDPLFYVWTPWPNQGYPAYLLEAGDEQGNQIGCATAGDLAKHMEQIFGSPSVKSRVRQWIDMAEERGDVR